MPDRPPVPPTHQTVRLAAGRHRSPDEGACVMEVVSMLSGLSFTDHPATACPVIGSFLRAYNDVARDADRQALLACASLVVGSRNPAAQQERVDRCYELAAELRVARPRWWRGLMWLSRGLSLPRQSPAHTEVMGRNRVCWTLGVLLGADADGPARVLALVEELVAMGQPRVTRDRPSVTRTREPAGAPT